MNIKKKMGIIYTIIMKKVFLLLFNISPKLLIKFRFNLLYYYYKKRLSFSNPITLDEKIQWMKLNYYKDNPLISQCADKYAVRDYVKKMDCEDILIDLYGVYDNSNEIPWDKLPNKFVIKWNCGCGQNLICSDKSELDIEETIKKLDKWKNDARIMYKYGAEMQYKPIVPKLIVEKFIETQDGLAPVDYKLYCFHGEPYCLLTCTGRESGRPKFYFVDKDWKLMRLNKSGKEAPEGFVPPKPEGYERLFDYARKLSKPFPFVRADFYLEQGKIIFGELTFTPCAGFDTYRLFSTNELFGQMVNLSKITQ